jgi:prolyl oligopeptidase
MPLRPLLPLTLAVALAACGGDADQPSDSPAPPSPPAAQAESLAYPAARTVDVVDDYHGTKVADPYRWMEDLDSPELARWIAAQNALTERWLADVPGRERIRQRLEALWNYDRYAYVRPGSDTYGVLPVKRGNRYFYSRNDGLANQYVVYAQDGLDGEPRVVLDPNTFSADGTVSLADVKFSNDGRLIAYSTSSGGSDWREIRVRDVDGRDRDDRVKWAKFSNIEWAHDDSGFYYTRYDEPKENELKAVVRFQKLYFHKVGTPQSADTLVYWRRDQPDWFFDAQVSDDGRWLVMPIGLGTDERNLIFHKRNDRPDAPVVELIAEWKATYQPIAVVDDTLYLRTDDGAPRYRVVAVDLAKGPPATLREVVPESDATLVEATLVGRTLIANYLRDARSEIALHALDGRKLSTLALPGLGSAGGFRGAVDQTETFYSYMSYDAPPALYRLDLASGATAPFRAPTVAFDPTRYETRQVFYTSKDGTRVPMFLIGRKSLAPTGDIPTILYGYGGFNSPQTPTYSASVIAWLEMGGLYAVANLRGGGEYGRPWHEAGMKLNKQNVFDDMIAAAEFLIAQRWTNPKKLAVSGRSNGGLLVGAVINQRPELFGAALPAVGVMDMLRFREFTIGWAWESDYGSVRNPDEFRAIHAYSPLHNIRPDAVYPATLVTTADHDDRVFPAHSFKYTAAMQALVAKDNPVLIRVETRAGHGAGKPTTKIIAEQADIYAFLVKALSMTVP